MIATSRSGESVTHQRASGPAAERHQYSAPCWHVAVRMTWTNRLTLDSQLNKSSRQSVRWEAGAAGAPSVSRPARPAGEAATWQRLQRNDPSGVPFQHNYRYGGPSARAGCSGGRGAPPPSTCVVWQLVKWRPRHSKEKRFAQAAGAVVGASRWKLWIYSEGRRGRRHFQLAEKEGQRFAGSCSPEESARTWDAQYLPPMIKSFVASPVADHRTPEVHTAALAVLAGDCRGLRQPQCRAGLRPCHPPLQTLQQWRLRPCSQMPPPPHSLQP